MCVCVCVCVVRWTFALVCPLALCGVVVVVFVVVVVVVVVFDSLMVTDFVGRAHFKYKNVELMALQITVKKNNSNKMFSKRMFIRDDDVVSTFIPISKFRNSIFEILLSNDKTEEHEEAL